MIQTNQLSVKGLHHATIFGEVQMREVSYYHYCEAEVKMGKNINTLYKKADIFLFLSFLTFILRPNGSDLFLIPLVIYSILFLTDKKSINLNINKFLYLIWLSLGILFLGLVSRYFSFSFHHLDSGIYHNMIINLVTNGSYFDDMNQIHGFGIHFEPIIYTYFLSFIFFIYPMLLLVNFVKIFSCILFFYHNLQKKS